MAKYVCGPSVLHLDGKSDPVQPGDRFDYEFSESQEASLLAADAIAKDDTPAPAPTRAARPVSPPAGPSDGAVSKE